MVTLVPRPFDASRDFWLKTLAPWLRALEGKISLSLPATAGSLPTRDDVQQLRINVSMARVGRDRGLWCAILEALELLNALWYVDQRLCWSFALHACGRSITQLPFPLNFVDGVRPSYVLCVVEEDVVYDFEQIMDVFDVFIMGAPEWNRSPTFHSTLKMLHGTTARGVRPPITVSCHFSFEDDPVGVLPYRIESVAAVQNLARFLQMYQEPAQDRTDEDSAFFVTSFEFDFSDGPLIAHELSALTSIVFAIPVTSLRFGAWNSAWMPPRLVDDFCNNAFARRNYREPEVTGIETLAFHPTDLLDVDTFDICWAISESDSLRRISFSDAWLGGVANDSLRRQWIEWALFAIFRNNSETQTKFHTASLKLRYCKLSDIVSIRDGLSLVTEQNESPPSPPSSVYETASEGEQDVDEAPEIELYRVSSYDFTSIADDPDEVSSAAGSSSESGALSVILPEPAPFRSSVHPVRHLTIELDHDTDDEPALDIVTALAWFVGEPLTRLTIIDSRPRGAVSVLTARHVEQVLTACPSLERLELYSVRIESLSPFMHPSLCGQLRTLVIDWCSIQDKESVEDFYAALSDPTQTLYQTLKALHLCEEDETSIETAHFALKMLAKNDKLQQFVIRSHSDGVALKLLHRFRLFDGVPIAGESEASMPLASKLALLSIMPLIFGAENVQISSIQDTMACILEMAATPLRRHCTVVSS